MGRGGREGRGREEGRKGGKEEGREGGRERMIVYTCYLASCTTNKLASFVCLW